MEQLIGARLGWLEHDPHKLTGLTTKKSFAPIAKMNTIRVLFSLVVTQDWPLHQLDIKKIFFFMKIWRKKYIWNCHLALRKNLRVVCRLRKSLYKLKRSSCAWF